MSRIFEALRRTEQQSKSGSPPVGAPDDGLQCQELLTSLEREPSTLKQVERLVSQPRPEDHIVGHSPNQHMVGEKFKLLRHHLDQLRQHRPITSVLVTSTVPEEGKTMVTVNLAIALAMTASRVLLVDSDLRRPDIHTTLRVGPLPGLAEFLEDRLDLLSAYRRVDPFGFYYMPAGHFTSKPVELLQSARMHKFFKQATSEFDWVILDSPPLLPFADGHCLAALSDAVLLVVRDGFTTRDEFRRSLTSLKDTYIAGVILNGADGPLNEPYYSYYKSPAKLTEPRTRNLTFGQLASK